MISFEIPGKPSHTRRPRARAIGSGKHAFVSFYIDPKEQAERKAAEPFIEELEEKLEGPLMVTIALVYPRRKADKQGPPFPKDTKPDLDNCIKFVMDMMNGRVYADDSCVAGVAAWKTWAGDGVEPGTHVFVSPFEDEEDE